MINLENTLYNDLIYLINCSIHGRAAKHIETMDLDSIYRIAQYHTLSAMICMALESADNFSNMDETMIKQWTDLKVKAVRKNILLDTERIAICQFFEAKGIWYMPLKGILIKDMYPRIGMRQMADNDILYDAKFQNEVKEFMVNRGYDVESVGKGDHDVYLKKPIYNYEMHMALYDESHSQAWQNYYENIKKRLVKDENSQYGYHFNDEDFYIYVISHMHKHYSVGGTGLRSLIDLYIILEKFPRLKWKYINKQLKKLDLLEFEEESKNLVKKVFSLEKCELTEKELDSLCYYFKSGTYGTLQYVVQSRIRQQQPGEQPITNKTKRQYIIKRIFPDKEFYKQVPLVYKHKWLRPFFVIQRICRGLIKRRKAIFQELKIVLKLK